MCFKLHDLLNYLSEGVCQITGFSWLFIYGCVPNHMIYLTFYPWMSLKLHDVFDHYLWMCSKLHDYLTIYLRVYSTLRDYIEHLSKDVFQTTWFTWPFIYGCDPNYMMCLTIYLWMCSKLLAFLDHLSMHVFKTTWFTWPFIYGYVSNYLMCLIIIYWCVPNYIIYLTIYLWMWFKQLALLDNLSMDVFKTTWCCWPLSMDVF